MSTLEMIPNECEQSTDSSVSSRTLANRRNALKSTGPRTDAGKAISRRNAVKLGLAGQGLVLPLEVEHEASERTENWLAVARPRNPIEEEIVRLASVTLSQLHACHREEALARARLVDRAEHLWDADREAETAALADQLADKPERVVSQLRRTAHGAFWLLGRWLDLESRLVEGRDWDEAAHSHALDLLAVPTVFRDRHSPLDRPDAETNPDALRAQRLAVARDQIATLEDIIDNGLIPLDDDDRALRLGNIVVVPDPVLSRLNRYERTLSSRFMSLLSKIQRFSSAGSRESGASPSNQTNPKRRVATVATNMPAQPISTHQDASVLAATGSGSPSALAQGVTRSSEAVPSQAGPSPVINSLRDALSHIPPGYVEMTPDDLRHASHQVDMNDTLLVQSLSDLLRTLPFEESAVPTP